MTTKSMTVYSWIYATRPAGEVGEANYRLAEEQVDFDLALGEALVEVEFWSVDPYMRIQQSANDTWSQPHPIGEVQGGRTVGRVIEVSDPSGTLQVGDWVENYMGWRTHGICRVEECRQLDVGDIPPSSALHALGMPGFTAYFGLLEAGQPKAGDTLLVSGAAGAVGHLVGQIGKLSGCFVIGVVGSQEKADFIVNELGFDAAINYRKATSLAKAVDLIVETAPRGVDVYFDNTGGVISDALFITMNPGARIVICGQISQYQGGLDEPVQGPRLLHHMLYKRATMRGILASDYFHRGDELRERMSAWIRTGQVKAKETTLRGFETLPSALTALFKGQNTGKLVVRK